MTHANEKKDTELPGRSSRLRTNSTCTTDTPDALGAAAQFFFMYPAPDRESTAPKEMGEHIPD